MAELILIVKFQCIPFWSLFNLLGMLVATKCNKLLCEWFWHTFDTNLPPLNIFQWIFITLRMIFGKHEIPFIMPIPSFPHLLKEKLSVSAISISVKWRGIHFENTVSGPCLMLCLLVMIDTPLSKHSENHTYIPVHTSQPLLYPPLAEFSFPHAV